MSQPVETGGNKPYDDVVPTAIEEIRFTSKRRDRALLRRAHPHLASRTRTAETTTEARVLTGGGRSLGSSSSDSDKSDDSGSDSDHEPTPAPGSEPALPTLAPSFAPTLSPTPVTSNLANIISSGTGEISPAATAGIALGMFAFVLFFVGAALIVFRQRRKLQAHQRDLVLTGATGAYAAGANVGGRWKGGDDMSDNGSVI